MAPPFLLGKTEESIWSGMASQSGSPAGYTTRDDDPSNVQFFNEHWQSTGDKKTQARTLTEITRVPKHILTDGLFILRPCVAQVMSWAADRMTT